MNGSVNESIFQVKEVRVYCRADNIPLIWVSSFYRGKEILVFSWAHGFLE